MLKYIARRIFQMIPVFIGVTIVLFVITTVVPGDPIRVKMGFIDVHAVGFKARRALPFRPGSRLRPLVVIVAAM